VPGYLDHAATAGMSAEALAAYVAAAEVVGNPSSLHSAGQAARRVVEDARESIAADLGAHPSELVFTSGGTESNNLAIKGIYWATVARDPSQTGLAVSALEHHSVLEPARWLAQRGADLVILPVTPSGVIAPQTPQQLKQMALVSVMLASNEIGTIQPIQQLAELAHSVGIPMHTDAVAALGQIPISFSELDVDAMSIAAHKIGGPMGVGALLVKRGLPIEPLHHGGEHERGIRAGTLNVPGVASFAVALQTVTNKLLANQKHLTELRDRLISGVLGTIATAQLTGVAGLNRLPGNASFVFPGCDPDALLFGLDNQGFAASIGAACAAGVARPSEALLACGLNELDARSSLRFTLGPTTTVADVEQLIKVLPGIVHAAQNRPAV